MAPELPSVSVEGISSTRPEESRFVPGFFLEAKIHPMCRQTVHNQTHWHTMPKNIQADISEVGNAYSRHCI